jgi:hypothetical protein
MRLKILENISDDTKDEEFKIHLKNAKFEYLRLAYPYNPEIEELPNDKAKDWQVRCAIELYNLEGGGNLISYSENGLQEVYSKAGISEDLINEIAPRVGVPK